MEAVDAFTCDWSGENNSWCPTIFLVLRVLRHANVTKANGTLVVPRWVSAPFCLMLYPDGVHTAGLVRGVYELPCVNFSF